MSIPALRDDGNLPDGKHVTTLKDIQATYVTNSCRQRIWDNFLLWLSEARRHFVVEKLWVGGSFVTEKAEPSDIDVTVWLSGESSGKVVREIEKSRFASLFTFQKVKVKWSENKVLLIDRLQSGNGVVDAFLARNNNVLDEKKWYETWTKIDDISNAKGFLEVRF